MASKLNALPETARSKTMPLPDEWFDGSWWSLRQGEDFHTGAKSFRDRFRAEASRRGLQAEFVSDRGDVTIQYVRAHG